MNFYKESGKVNVILTVIWSAVFAAVIGGMAYGYAYITNYNPFIYFNILITIGYILLTGVFLVLVKTFGKIRNFRVAVLVSAIIAFIGLYAVWVSYISIQFDNSLGFAVENFGRCLDALSNTSFSIGRALRSSSIEFSGGMLYALWIIEALLLVGGPIFMVYSMGKNDAVFCEACNKWADDDIKLKKVLKEKFTTESLESLAVHGNLKTLFQLEDVLVEEENHYELEVAACPNCKENYYLKVDEVKFSKNDKGKYVSDAVTLLPYHEIEKFAIPAAVLSKPVESE